ncbi:hypothetical protein AAC387_Pa04g0542 [Persea americana]
MKSICIISILLITVYHLTSPPIADATSIPTSPNEHNSINEKQPMRGMKGLISAAASNFPKSPENKKVVAGGMERLRVEKGGLVGEEVDLGDDGEGLVYNVDYHGVTTHPPSPKHPSP